MISAQYLQQPFFLNSLKKQLPTSFKPLDESIPTPSITCEENVDKFLQSLIAEKKLSSDLSLLKVPEKDFRPLNEAILFKLVDQLMTPISIADNATFTMAELFLFLEEDKVIKEIEVVGGNVPYVLGHKLNDKGESIDNHYVESILDDLDIKNVPPSVIEGFSKKPGDVDYRIIVKEANYETIRQLHTKIFHFLCEKVNIARRLSKLPELNDEEKNEIQRTAFKKYFLPLFPACYAEASWQDVNGQGIDMFITHEEVERKSLFVRDAIRLPISTLVHSLGQYVLIKEGGPDAEALKENLKSGTVKLSITPISDFHTGCWQPFMDRINKVIRAVDPKMINESGWPLLHSAHLKGERGMQPELESILWQTHYKAFEKRNKASSKLSKQLINELKILEQRPSSEEELLACQLAYFLNKAVDNQHQKKPEAYTALALQTVHSLIAHGKEGCIPFLWKAMRQASVKPLGKPWDCIAAILDKAPSLTNTVLAFLEIKAFLCLCGESQNRSGDEFQATFIWENEKPSIRLLIGEIPLLLPFDPKSALECMIKNSQEIQENQILFESIDRAFSSNVYAAGGEKSAIGRNLNLLKAFEPEILQNLVSNFLTKGMPNKKSNSTPLGPLLINLMLTLQLFQDKPHLDATRIAEKECPDWLENKTAEERKQWLKKMENCFGKESIQLVQGALDLIDEFPDIPMWLTWARALAQCRTSGRAATAYELWQNRESLMNDGTKAFNLSFLEELSYARPDLASKGLGKILKQISFREASHLLMKIWASNKEKGNASESFKAAILNLFTDFCDAFREPSGGKAPKNFIDVIDGLVLEYLNKPDFITALKFSSMASKVFLDTSDENKLFESWSNWIKILINKEQKPEALKFWKTAHEQHIWQESRISKFQKLVAKMVSTKGQVASFYELLITEFIKGDFASLSIGLKKANLNQALLLLWQNAERDQFDIPWNNEIAGTLVAVLEHPKTDRSAKLKLFVNYLSMLKQHLSPVVWTKIFNQYREQLLSQNFKKEENLHICLDEIQSDGSFDPKEWRKWIGLSLKMKDTEMCKKGLQKVCGYFSKEEFFKSTQAADSAELFLEVLQAFKEIDPSLSLKVLENRARVSEWLKRPTLASWRDKILNSLYECISKALENDRFVKELDVGKIFDSSFVGEKEWEPIDQLLIGSLCKSSDFSYRLKAIDIYFQINSFDSAIKEFSFLVSESTDETHALLLDHLSVWIKKIVRMKNKETISFALLEAPQIQKVLKQNSDKSLEILKEIYENLSEKSRKQFRYRESFFTLALGLTSNAKAPNVTFWAELAFEFLSESFDMKQSLRSLFTASSTKLVSSLLMTDPLKSYSLVSLLNPSFKTKKETLNYLKKILKKEDMQCQQQAYACLSSYLISQGQTEEAKSLMLSLEQSLKSNTDEDWRNDHLQDLLVALIDGWTQKLSELDAEGNRAFLEICSKARKLSSETWLKILRDFSEREKVTKKENALLWKAFWQGFVPFFQEKGKQENDNEGNLLGCWHAMLVSLGLEKRSYYQGVSDILKNSDKFIDFFEKNHIHWRYLYIIAVAFGDLLINFMISKPIEKRDKWVRLLQKFIEKIDAYEAEEGANESLLWKKFKLNMVMARLFGEKDVFDKALKDLETLLGSSFQVQDVPKWVNSFFRCVNEYLKLEILEEKEEKDRKESLTIIGYHYLIDSLSFLDNEDNNTLPEPIGKFLDEIVDGLTDKELLEEIERLLSKEPSPILINIVLKFYACLLERISEPTDEQKIELQKVLEVLCEKIISAEFRVQRKPILTCLGSASRFIPKETIEQLIEMLLKGQKEVLEKISTESGDPFVIIKETWAAVSFIISSTAYLNNEQFRNQYLELAFDYLLDLNYFRDEMPCNFTGKPEAFFSFMRDTMKLIHVNLNTFLTERKKLNDIQKELYTCGEYLRAIKRHVKKNPERTIAFSFFEQNINGLLKVIDKGSFLDSNERKNILDLIEEALWLPLPDKWYPYANWHPLVCYHPKLMKQLIEKAANKNLFASDRKRALGFAHAYPLILTSKFLSEISENEVCETYLSIVDRLSMARGSIGLKNILIFFDFSRITPDDVRTLRFEKDPNKTLTALRAKAFSKNPKELVECYKKILKGIVDCNSAPLSHNIHFENIAAVLPSTFDSLKTINPEIDWNDSLREIFIESVIPEVLPVIYENLSILSKDPTKECKEAIATTFESIKKLLSRGFVLGCFKERYPLYLEFVQKLTPFAMDFAQQPLFKELAFKITLLLLFTNPENPLSEEEEKSRQGVLDEWKTKLLEIKTQDSLFCSTMIENREIKRVSPNTSSLAII